MTGASHTPAGTRPAGTGAPVEVVTVAPDPATGVNVAAALASAGGSISGEVVVENVS
jgi:hypothetical protein